MQKHPHDKLTCTMEQFEAIHAANAKTKRTSQTVTVDRAALQALLIDHTRLIQLAEKSNG